nr:maleylpyruvate isomerase N-terminal domain-containing protein [Kineococcus vitellinus]
MATWSQLLGAVDAEVLAAPSRCAGWSTGAVLVHVHQGLREVIPALRAVRGRDRPSADAASSWARSAGRERAAGRVEPPQAVTEPQEGHPVARLAGAVDALAAELPHVPAGYVDFRGEVLTTGDLLATRAVELAVHHLDLDLIGSPPAAAALRLARLTCEALAGTHLPVDWDDTTAVLAGSGRVALTGAVLREHPRLQGAFPSLG